MATGDAYLEVLSRAECLELLPTVPVGWISYCHASQPQLVPVNFVVHQDEVMARTSYGSKLTVVSDLSAYEVFIAGAPGFVTACTQAARRLGVAPGRLHTEEFYAEPHPWA